MKLTRKEWHWIFYDVGNSAFILLTTAVLPIIFKNLAEGHLSSAQYLACWGYAVSLSTLVTAILGPILGAVADRRMKRKLFFTLFMLMGSIACMSLSAWSDWLVYLIAFVIAKIGYNGSLVFYDAMLIDITDEKRIDNVSSQGYAWGYIGSCVPFIISIALLLKHDLFGLSMRTGVILVFLLNGLWWLGWSLPLLKDYKQVFGTQNPDQAEKGGALLVFRHMRATLKEIKERKKIYLFLIAFLFYIDGVYTIITMATAYATSLGLSEAGLILALLVTQLVAFPAALLFGHISKKHPAERLIKICIAAYGLITLYAIQLDQVYEFWILAIAVGIFQGAIQALSRSYYAKIIPPEKSGEYFGIYDIFGKGASLLGTLMISVITQLTNNQHLAILSLVLMFILGFAVFTRAAKTE